MKKTDKSSLFFSSILDNASVAIVACDSHGTLNYMNGLAYEFIGDYKVDLALNEWSLHYSVYHPDGTLMDPKEMPLYRALQGEKVENQEILVKDPTDRMIFLACNGQSLYGSDGEKMGAFIALRDITETRERSETIRTRFRALFEQSPLSIQLLDKSGRTILVNPAFKKLWSVEDEFVENYILKHYNILEDKLLEESGQLELIKRGFAGETTFIDKFHYDPAKLGLAGRSRWTSGIVYPLKDTTGQVREVVVIHEDHTERHNIEKEREKLSLNQQFLAEVKTILLSTLDYDQMIEQLASAAVPFLADGCMIDLEEGGAVKRIFCKHIDPKIEANLISVQHTYPSVTALKTIQEGKIIHIPKVTEELLRLYSSNEEHFEKLKELSPTSFISVPMRIRGNVIGALRFFTSSIRAPLDELAVTTALELGRSAAVAIDNASLYKNAQSAIQIRDEFISIASHELRTPMTSLTLQAKILTNIVSELQTPDADLAKKVLQKTSGQLNRLARLVDDMLDITRISTGKLTIIKRTVDLSKVIQETLDKLHEHLESLGIEHSFNFEGPMLVDCDPNRIEQVVTNLLTNAIRYGKRNPIEVSLTNDASSAFIKVKDDGQGIGKEDLMRIFDRYERAASNTENQGLGLGLYINREIVREHGGEISVASELNRGSTFTVVLPLI